MAFLSDIQSFLATNLSAGAVLTFVVVFIFCYMVTRKPYGIPPGSALILPFLGDLPLLITGDILKTFRRLRTKHGDIFSFYMGRKLIIVINSFELIQKAAVRKGGLFSGRPRNFFSSESCGDSGKGIILSDGPFWQRQRKFTHDRLQEFGFGKSAFEAKILEEVNNFIDVLKSQNDQPFDIKDIIHASMANVIFGIVCGTRHDYKDPVFLRLLSDFDHNTKVGLRIGMLHNCFPCFEYLPLDRLGLEALKIQNDSFRTYAQTLYEEHMRAYKDDNIGDLMDAYIREMKRDNYNKEISDFTFDQLVTVTTDLLGAGSETGATVIRWAVLYLLHYPEIKQCLKTDIDNVVPNSRRPCLDDRAKLPFVEAFIMELLRITNIAPFGIPHAILGEKDIVFEGYRIPKDSSIFFNYETALYDPRNFPDPFRFKPERFINNSGRLFKPKELIPFGIGRRICLGEPVARMELFLFLTAMIKEFDFLPQKDGKLPSLQPVLGLTNAPTEYKVRIVSRCKI